MKAILIITALLTCLFCVRGEESTGWETLITHKSSEKELRALPVVAVHNTNDTCVYLRVENRTGINIRYYGYNKDTPQIFIKEKREGKWVATSWDWCGTGMESHVLKNKTTITFQIQVTKNPLQVFTIFRNAKDSKEFSLIKLYEKNGG